MAIKFFIANTSNLYIDGDSNISTSTSYPTTTLAHEGEIKVKFKNSTGGYSTGYIPIFTAASS